MSKKETRNLTRCNIISGGDTRHWNGDKTEDDDRGLELHLICDENVMKQHQD